jgi:hypothetical protein
MRLWILTIILLAIIIGGVCSYVLYNKANTVTSDKTWSPMIEVTPNTPSVGDSVKIYVELVYSGSKGVNVNPFELRSKYSTNLTIIDLVRNSTYLSRSLGYSYRNTDLNEKPIMIKPGDRIGIGYTEIIFTRPGRYEIKAHVKGPGLITNEATAEIEVKPKTIRISYENESRVNDWILSVRVEPKNPTVHDNLTLKISLRYVGNNEFKVEGSVPLIKMVKLVHVNGTDYWSMAIPSHISYIDVKPGYNQSFKFIVGEKAPFPHKFVPGIYKVEVYATGYTPEGRSLDITVTLFIEIEGS